MPTADRSLIVVKWLVPTAGILFGLVGYVVNSAHRSLLGFPTDEGGIDSGRAADAADFLRFLLTLLGDRALALRSLEPLSLGGHGALLAWCALAIALVLAINAVPLVRRVRVLSSAVLVALVIAFLGTKFVWFDAPVMRIEGAIVGVGVPEVAMRLQQGNGAAPAAGVVSAASAATRSMAEQLKAPTGGGLDKRIAERASAIWRLMVCSRIGEATLPNADLATDAHCASLEPRDGLAHERAQRTLAGEFDAALVLGALIAVAALALLAQGGPRSSAVAVLALAYLLTLPYAWGKLLKPYAFTFAQVRVIPGTLLAGAEASATGETVYAFVLARDGGAITLLQAVPERCSTGPSVALRFSSIPVSKVVAIEQIYRLDVIDWAVRTQRQCPPMPSPTKPTGL